MEAKELRQFTTEELSARVRQWRDELFRAKFKQESSEARDTSTFKKLRRDIARGLTILNEKQRVSASGAVNPKGATGGAAQAAVAPQDKAVTAPATAPQEEPAPKKKTRKARAEKE